MDPALTPRFRTRLWWIVALLLVLVLLIVAASIATSRRQHEAQAVLEASSVARVLESDFQSLVDKINLALQVLGTEVEDGSIGSRTGEKMAPSYLGRIRASLPDIEGFRAFGADGQLTLATDPADSPSTNLESETYVGRLRDPRHRGITISHPHPHRANGVRVVDFVLPVRHADDTFAGVIVAYVPLERLTRMLSAADVGANGAVSLRGGGLEIIARYPPLPASKAATYGPDQMRISIERGVTSGNFHAVAPLDGAERLFSYRKVNGYPLYVTVARATSDYLGHWRRDMGVVALLATLLLGVIVGASVMIDRAWRRQEHAAHVLEEQAHTDVLTGLANRRRFFEMAEAELARTKRYNAPLSVLMLDIDHFKKVNDKHGHHAGDLVLRSLARTVLEVLRNVDIAGRIGGEEFAILLPETTLEGAVEVAERLRVAIERSSVPREAGVPLRYTISLGVTALAEGANLDVLMSQADTAMYEAKRAGRNRVNTFSASTAS